MAYPYIMTNSAITVIVEGKPTTTQSDDINYDKIRQAIMEQDWDQVKLLADKEKQVAEFSKDNITVKNGTVFFKGEAMHSYVASKILQFIEEDLDAEPLINFLTKLMDNPSKRCVDQLFSFLEHKNMPIDPDGDFYAYKAVRGNWTDKHTGTIDNSIGTIVEITRNKVDDDPTHDCSYGLHAGSMQYVSSFGNSGDHIIIVKINPKDIVSVPDCDTSKLRTCKYEVISEFENILPDTTYNYDEDEDLCPSCNMEWDDCCCEEDDDDQYYISY